MYVDLDLLCFYEGRAMRVPLTVKLCVVLYIDCSKAVYVLHTGRRTIEGRHGGRGQLRANFADEMLCLIHALSVGASK